MSMIVWMLAVAIVLVVVASLVSDWIYEPPLDPPVAVIRRRFGEINQVITQKGWVLVLPYIDTVEIHELTRFEVEVKPSEVLTPDNVSLSISVTLYLKHDETEEGILAMMKSGNVAGVKKILNDISEQEIRQWARSDEKPQTWQEAQSSQDGLVAKLKNKIIIQCGGAADDASGHLPKYGVFLDQVTVGEIFPLDENIRKEKELEAAGRLHEAAELAKVKLQKESSMVKINTELEVAELVAEKMHISKKEAFETLRKFDSINAGHGSVHQINLGDLLPMVKALIGEFRKGGV